MLARVKTHSRYTPYVPDTPASTSNHGQHFFVRLHDRLLSRFVVHVVADLRRHDVLGIDRHHVDVDVNVDVWHALADADADDDDNDAAVLKRRAAPRTTPEPRSMKNGSR